MTNETDSRKSKKEQEQAEKAARLAEALRANLRKRKDLQRNRGESAPAAIKNRTRLGD